MDVGKACHSGTAMGHRRHDRWAGARAVRAAHPGRLSLLNSASIRSCDLRRRRTVGTAVVRGNEVVRGVRETSKRASFVPHAADLGGLTMRVWSRMRLVSERAVRIIVASAAIASAVSPVTAEAARPRRRGPSPAQIKKMKEELKE